MCHPLFRVFGLCEAQLLLSQLSIGSTTERTRQMFDQRCISATHPRS
jgi:hypothetical protein